MSPASPVMRCLDLGHIDSQSDVQAVFRETPINCSPPRHCGLDPQSTCAFKNEIAGQARNDGINRRLLRGALMRDALITARKAFLQTANPFEQRMLFQHASASESLSLTKSPPKP
jgi:hypothetical protein